MRSYYIVYIYISEITLHSLGMRQDLNLHTYKCYELILNQQNFMLLCKYTVLNVTT